MGTVEDIRKVIQDFLAPELRAMTAELTAIRQIMDSRFDAVDTKFKSLSTEIAQVKELLDIDRRLAKLESKQSPVAQ
jgi:ABC-type long-subunit fatty acid transport system fused permease/ATPase subunit